MADIGDETAQRSRAEFLVVCGARSEANDWLFGNFMSIGMTLMT